MSSVGAFPGQTISHRRIIRAPVNPQDKSTVVSIFPMSFTEVKPTIQPGTFTVPAGTFEKPGILVVGPSSWWREIDEDQPFLEIPNSSIQIAESIVRDWANGLLGWNAVDSMPGVFSLIGEYDAEKVKKDHMSLLLKYQAHQKKWFQELVKIADILWSRSNGNPLSISDTARLACRELNISNKDWLKDSQMVDLVRCVACGALRNPLYPVCQACHAIVDVEKAKQLNLSFAKP